MLNIEVDFPASGIILKEDREIFTTVPSSVKSMSWRQRISYFPYPHIDPLSSVYCTDSVLVFLLYRKTTRAICLGVEHHEEI